VLLSRRNVNSVEGVLGVYTTNVVRPLRDTSSLTRRRCSRIEYIPTGALRGFGHEGPAARHSTCTRRCLCAPRSPRLIDCTRLALPFPILRFLSFPLTSLLTSSRAPSPHTIHGPALITAQKIPQTTPHHLTSAQCPAPVSPAHRARIRRAASLTARSELSGSFGTFRPLPTGVLCTSTSYIAIHRVSSRQSILRVQYRGILSSAALTHGKARRHRQALCRSGE
jgi:hypothetical protein